MNAIEKYYNKFNEDKRLKTRHGIVEFTITMEYIKKYIKNKKVKILDVGAGTGAYSIPLANEGHEVHAVELVKKNICVLKEKSNLVKTYHMSATNLKKFDDDQFDIVLVFGPMYHLFSEDDKLKVLSEAKRVLKKDGKIFVAYLLSDYAFIRHAIMDNYLKENISQGKIDSDFNIISNEDDLYSYIKFEDIEILNKKVNLFREKIIAPDGATDYIRKYINNLSEDDFKIYIDYQRKNCERSSLIGASSHVVDILSK